MYRTEPRVSIWRLSRAPLTGVRGQRGVSLIRGQRSVPLSGVRGQRGVSLAEILVSMAIASIGMAFAFSGYATLSELLELQKGVTSCQLEHSEVFTLLERDIKNAGADPTGAGLFSSGAAVEMVTGGADAGGLRLRADFTGPAGLPDGDLDDAGEVVIYRLAEDGVFYRRISDGNGGAVRQVLLRRVEAFTPSLEDDGGNQAALDAVTQVRITIRSRVAPDSDRLNAPIREQRFASALQNRLY